MDVRINGESIVQDGVAEIPAHKGRQTRNNFGTVIMGVDGDVTAYRNTSGEIGYRYLPLNSIDMAVKAAMCDGKGAAWTVEEQVAARERMGAWTGGWQIIMDETLAELTQEVWFEVPNDTKEMICFFKSGAAPASTPVYLHTNNINSSVAESFASFGGSLANNIISIGCQKIQFLNSQYGLVEYSYLSHSTPSSTDNAQRAGKTSVLRIDNKRFGFHSTNRNTGYPAETRLLVLVRR